MTKDWSDHFSQDNYKDRNLDNYLNFDKIKKNPFNKLKLMLAAGALLALGPCVAFCCSGSSKDYFRKSDLDVNKIHGKYELTLTEKNEPNPFVINDDLVDIIRKETKNCETELDKAKAIFYWMRKNISYDLTKYFTRTNGFVRNHKLFGDESGYRNSTEVIDDEEGICGESAFLYVTMARCVGLDSNIVFVNRDCYSDSVNHGCAVVHIRGKRILVDPAYDTFDIKHKEYRIQSDEEIIRNYRHWRKNE